MKVKKIVLSILSTTVISSTLMFNIGQVYAQTNDGLFLKFTNPFSKLVQMIAQKFNLDQTQVQSVFDQFWKERRQELQQNAQKREEERLDKLVTDGKITKEQKQAILDKLADLRNKYNPENFKDLTVEQRKEKFQEKQNEIKAWAQSQGIDPSYLMPIFGMGGRKSMGGFGHPGFWGKK